MELHASRDDIPIVGLTLAPKLTTIFEPCGRRSREVIDDTGELNGL